MRKKSKKREKQFISLADSENEDTRKRTRKPKNKFLANRGIIMLKNIPHGFYEKQMMAYFSQFGKVTNLKLNRSVKTGASKGIAFIEFQYEDVAKIVAETMNNYLMFNRNKIYLFIFIRLKMNSCLEGYNFSNTSLNSP